MWIHCNTKRISITAAWGRVTTDNHVTSALLREDVNRFTCAHRNISLHTIRNFIPRCCRIATRDMKYCRITLANYLIRTSTDVTRCIATVAVCYNDGVAYTRCTTQTVGVSVCDDIRSKYRR